VTNHPANATLDALFKDRDPEAVFPLHVPLADVFEGRNGWPQLYTSNHLGAAAAPPPRNRPSFGPDIQISDLVLKLDPPATSQIVANRDIVATFTLSNRGLGGASNVTLTGAQLKNTKAVEGTPSRQRQLAAGQARQMTVRFPGSGGAAGDRVVLRLLGSYLGGTFGASLRVQLP
jgi:hypothetical protein